MKKLEIELFRYDTLVFGKVLYMDESFRKNGDLYNNGTFKISSSVHPAIEMNALWVWGRDKGADDCVLFRRFEDPSDALEFIAEVRKGLGKINSDAAEGTKTVQEI